MCGITGIIHNNAGDYIEGMVSAIDHRGPDDRGVYAHGRIALGHTRLSILDVSKNGHQPMTSGDGRYVIVYNGEIYNHREIRRKLERKYNFKSTADTETLLYAYCEYGESVLDILNGIFAFAIYDTQKEELFIARDHFGIKPLYYYLHNGLFIFSSEVKSILQYPNVDKTIDFRALVNYFNFLWSPGEMIPFQYVKKLPAGYCMTLSTREPDNIKIRKYYDIPFRGEYHEGSEKDLVKQLEEHLFDAVERQLLSDVPLGFFLSGGLDSSTIVALARELHPDRDIRCYTIKTGKSSSFEGFANDLDYARIVAKHLRVDLVEVEAEVDIVQDLDFMIYHLDEPQIDAAPINVFRICKRAREEGYKVLLSGAGADDVFSGYRRHQALYYEKFFRFIPRTFGSLTRKYADNLNVNYPFLRRFKKILNDIDQPKMSRMYGYFVWLPLVLNKSLFNSVASDIISPFNPMDHFLELLKNIPGESSDLNKMLYWELKTFLVDQNLNYTDKLSMATGVETRVPFLDIDLVNFSTKIPPKLKMQKTTTKYILKKVMEKYLPKEIINRPKTGFGAPVREWILNDMDDIITTRLSQKSVSARGIFRYKSIKKMIEDNKSGKIDASYAIWGLLAMDSWFRQFYDG